jgi:hypothetical protein
MTTAPRLHGSVGLRFATRNMASGRHENRNRKANRGARRDKHDDVPQHHPRHVGPRGADGQADANLLRLTLDRVGDHPVKAGCGQDQRQQADRAEQDGADLAGEKRQADARIERLDLEARGGLDMAGNARSTYARIRSGVVSRSDGRFTSARSVCVRSKAGPI